MRPSLTVYIDEAGDPGVRDGLKYFGTRYEWFSLAAVVTRTAREPEIVDWIKELRSAANARQRPSLHYADITKQRRALVCESMARKPLRAFCLMSHKTNLRTYQNPRLGHFKEPHKFYNWCVRLLLERVMAWVAANVRSERLSLEPMRVIFSELGGHDYEHMYSYIDGLTMQVQAGTLVLPGKCWIPELADRRHWSVAPHTSVAGLQLCDVAASAFYQAANTKSPSWDTAPARSLQPIIAKDARDRFANTGVTVWPLSHQAPIPEDARPIFEHYGYRF